MRVRAWVAVMAAGLIWSAVAAGEPVGAEGRISLGAVLKLTYTSRDRSERTGVTGVSSAGLSWLELDITGAPSDRVSYVVELVADSALYRDPITGTGAVIGRSSQGEFGRVGIRRAEIRITDLIPWTTFRFGTMMPGWGLFQDRPTTAWDFVDLPLIYTRPDFKRLGWQNTGAAITVAPLDQLALDVAYLNGYFPDGRGNGESVLPGGGMDRGKAWVGRVRLMLGPVSLYGAYLDETWQEDRKGSSRLEAQHAAAWIAGANVSIENFWAIFEWTNITFDDYQLMTNGEFEDLHGKGGHAGVGWRPLPAWEALVRWEWVDPNTSDTRKTFNLSRFDQVAQWTVGVNYRPGPGAMVMVNFVMPEEEGHEVNLDDGKAGGKYQNRVNNYFRVQLQVWQ